MLFSRRISEHRPTLVLIALTAISLASLATGTKSSFIHDWGHTAVTVTAYPFLKAMHAVRDAFQFTTGLIFAYRDAREEADRLHQELVAASRENAQRAELIQENRRLRKILDFERGQPGLVLDPASVSPAKDQVSVLMTFKGMLMIDRGSVHGIRESMCAVTENGIVGIVTQVDPLTANVATLRSSDCNLGAMFVRNRVRGIVQGSSISVGRYCAMHYIDMKDDVRVGDQVVTSPESSFPSGIPIGRVVRVEEGNGVWKLAYLEPEVDIYKLDEVLIIKQAVTPAQEMLGVENGSPDAAPAESADKKNAAGGQGRSFPDTRTLQERYAP